MEINDNKLEFGLPIGFTDRVMGAISTEMKIRENRKSKLLILLYVFIGVCIFVGLLIFLSALKVVSFDGIIKWASDFFENHIPLEASAFSIVSQSISASFASFISFVVTIFQNFSSYYFIIILCFNFLLLYYFGELLTRQHK